MAMRNQRKVARQGGRPETKGERDLLDWFLREVRDAARVGEQLTVTVDPHTAVGSRGANVFFARCPSGWSADVGEIRRSKRSRRLVTR